MKPAASPPCAAVDRTRRIRELNDDLRQTGVGVRVMVTAGVAGFGKSFTAAALQRVAAFEAFELGNDPYGERDFGLITHKDQHMFWKIDYYDPTLSHAAEDPTDPQTCVRVLTLMLTSEY